MKLIKPAENKYDLVTRLFFLLFYAAGLIIAVSVGLKYMTVQAWLLGLLGAAVGATAYGMVAKLIIDMVRKDRQTARPDTLIKLFHVVFLAIATVTFLAIGFQYGDAKTWVIAFVGSYGGAFIYASIARLIITLTRKDDAQTATQVQSPAPTVGARV